MLTLAIGKRLSLGTVHHRLRTPTLAVLLDRTVRQQQEPHQGVVADDNAGTVDCGPGDIG